MKMKLFFILAFFSFKILAQCTGSFNSFASPPSISPQESTTINYSLTNSGAPCISAINIDITFDPAVLSNPNVVCGSASQVAGKVCQGNLTSEGNYRIIIYGGINVIGDGYIAYVSFQSLASASYGNTNINCVGSASDPDGDPVTITFCQQTTINIVPPNLSCSANANPQSGSVPLTVYFTSSASGGVEPYNFNWQFGDGESSTLQNPQHTYTEPGIFVWDLTIKDSLNQSCQRSGQIYAGILECIASANPEGGYAPLTVQFTSSASGGKAPYNYNWDFGDGESSTLQNPQHTYKNKGKYNWRLTVSDSSNQECIKEGEINVEEEAQYIYFIPASAESIGAEGTNWKTDLALYNEGEDIAQIKLYFLERGKDNRNSEEKVINLNSRNSIRINEIIKNIFNKENTSGGIKIKANQKLKLSSRTYNQMQGEVGGTYGQFIPGFSIDEAIDGESIIIQLIKNIRYRTNIGFLNGTENSINLCLKVYKSNGEMIGEKEINLLPLEYKQEDNLIDKFTKDEIEDGFAIIDCIDEGERFFAYASVVDNTTGDAIFIPAKK